MTMGIRWLRLKIPRKHLALEPKVNGVTTNIKQLASLTSLDAIALDSLYNFLAQIITVRLDMRNLEDKATFSLRPKVAGSCYIVRNYENVLLTSSRR
jgi:hypothetical protein